MYFYKKILEKINKILNIIMNFVCKNKFYFYFLFVIGVVTTLITDYYDITDYNTSLYLGLAILAFWFYVMFIRKYKKDIKDFINEYFHNIKK